jgi:hypothetical protein
MEVPQGHSIFVDDLGHLYAGGSTYSSNFPTTSNAFDTSYNGSNDGNHGDGWIIKVNQDGSDLILSSYIGGSNGDRVQHIFVDEAYNIFLAGLTQSPNFPETFGEPFNGGLLDAFLAKLSPDGTSLEFSKFMGGSQNDRLGSVRTNKFGEIFVVYDTESDGFYTTPDAYLSTKPGLKDAHFQILSSDGSTILYSTYLGTSGIDSFNIWRVGENGEVYFSSNSSGDGRVLKFVVPNQSPLADADGPYYGEEGNPIGLNEVSATDPDGDALTFSWAIDSSDCTFSDASVLNPTLTCKDNGQYQVTLTVSDGVNEPVSSTADVFVANLPPENCTIAAPLEPVPVGIEISTTVSFTDPGVLDTHTVTWDWEDTTTSEGIVDESNGVGSASGSHIYTLPDVYTVTSTVTDKDGDSCNPIFQFVVVYDPDGGFVTGGGWFNSPASAYAADPSLSGKATFGFVSKYKKGATIPTGNTEFQFHAGDLNFHSSDYDWLVVTGSDYAKFKGTGTINGEGEYKFMIWAGDNDVDTFSIKIWEEVDEVETVIYDNGIDQPIEGGNIVVHTK